MSSHSQLFASGALVTGSPELLPPGLQTPQETHAVIRSKVSNQEGGGGCPCCTGIPGIGRKFRFGSVLFLYSCAFPSRGIRTQLPLDFVRDFAARALPGSLTSCSPWTPASPQQGMGIPGPSGQQLARGLDSPSCRLAGGPGPRCPLTSLNLFISPHC